MTRGIWAYAESFWQMLRDEAPKVLLFYEAKHISLKSDSAADMNHSCATIPALRKCSILAKKCRRVMIVRHLSRAADLQSESLTAICCPNRLGFKSDPRVRPSSDWQLVTACLQLHCESSDSISLTWSSEALMCGREGPTWPRPLWVRLAGDLEDRGMELNCRTGGGCVYTMKQGWFHTQRFCSLVWPIWICLL